MDIIGPAVNEVVKCTCIYLAKEVDYAIKLKSIREVECEEAKTLRAIKKDVEDKITDAPQMKASNECNDWLNKVNKILIDVGPLDESYKSEKISGFYARRKQGKDSSGKIDKIKELINGREQFKGDALVGNLKKVLLKDGLAIEAGTSTRAKINSIVSCILDSPVIHRIGVAGPGGVGKTVILEEVNNHPEIAKKFGIIIWVTIGQDWELRKVQKEIADRLMLSVAEDDSESTVRDKLFNKLGSMRYLLFLDNVWEKVDLPSVGVPNPTKDNGCKVILSTRLVDICYGMGTEEVIKVDYLGKDEAQEMFRKSVGDKLIEKDEIKGLAAEIVKKCAGSPLAINAIGGSLQDQDNSCVWRALLDQLQSPDTSQMELVEGKIFETLKSSYIGLKDENTQNCFLYCALFSEGHEIRVDELIEYWRAEGYINDAGNVDEAGNAGHAILDKLVKASLLRSVEERSYVKMHDLFRDLALKIARENDQMFLVRADVKVNKIKQEWTKAHRISFMSGNIQNHHLPNYEVDCPKLITLLLKSNEKLKKIPDSFFSRMPVLQVLDLSHTKIESLPPSFSFLSKLQALYLTDTCLRVLPDCPKFPVLTTLVLQRNPDLSIPDSFFEHMSSLQILDLSHTRIELLPSSIDKLENLQVVDFSNTKIMVLPSFYSIWTVLQKLILKNCPFLQKLPLGSKNEVSLLEVLDLRQIDADHSGFATRRKFPRGILEALPLLKELRIEIGTWEVEEGVEKEVASLENITALSFPFRTFDAYESFIDQSKQWKEGKLDSFIFYVGSHCGLRPPTSYKRHLAFKSCYESKQRETLLEFSSSMQKVYSCEVLSCSVFKSFIAAAAEMQLKEVYLRRAWKICKFCAGRVKLNNLRILELSECPLLEEIFSLSLLPHLCCLEVLKVEQCAEIKEIIKDDNDDNDDNLTKEVPKLKILVLCELPLLFKICPESVSFKWPSLESIHVQSCSKLNSLPLDEHKASHLKEIKSEREWLDALECGNDASKEWYSKMWKAVL